MSGNSLWLAILVTASMVLTGCGSTPPENSQLKQARTELDSLKGNKSVRAYAPTELFDAEQALKRAESADEKEQAVSDHQLYLARQHMEVAKAVTESNVIKEQTKTLGDERDRLALAAREAELAKSRSELGESRSELDASRARSRELEAELAALEAKRTERGMLVTLNDVFFGTALARIAPGASRTLDVVVDVLKKNPDQRIIIEGHTDSTGPADFNQALSEQRAAAVKEALVARGIDGGRIDTRGYGESRPVASDANEGGRQLNRRVELVFPET